MAPPVVAEKNQPKWQRKRPQR